MSLRRGSSFTFALILTGVLRCSGVSGAEVDDVVVGNVAESTQAVLRALKDARVLPQGTVYTNVTLDDDGRARLGDLFGSLQLDELATDIVRAATPALRFAMPSDWLSPLTRRAWAVFWAFQNEECQEQVFDVPRDVTLIRVCANRSDSRYPKVRVRFEPNVHATTVQPKTLMPMECKYPTSARARGESGATNILLRVDAAGSARALRTVESSGSRQLDEAARDCFERGSFEPWGGTAPGDGLLIVRWTWMLTD